MLFSAIFWSEKYFLEGKYFLGGKSGLLVGIFTAVMEITPKSWCSKPDRSCSDWSRTGIPFYRTAELDLATTNGALQEAAPGRPELPYEPDQNGRKSGRGDFDRKKAVSNLFAFREKTPRMAEKHSRDGGTLHKVCVSRPRGGNVPGNHAKTTVYHSTPGTPPPPGCKLGGCIPY